MWMWWKHCHSDSFLVVRLHFDFVVFATSAQHRLKTIREFYQNSTADYVLLEKIMFLTKRDGDEAKALFTDYGSKAYMHCPRRLNKCLTNVKNKLSGKPISMTVFGEGWGLATNGLHFLDLFIYVSKSM